MIIIQDHVKCNETIYHASVFLPTQQRATFENLRSSLS